MKFDLVRDKRKRQFTHNIQVIFFPSSSYRWSNSESAVDVIPSFYYSFVLYSTLLCSLHVFFRAASCAYMYIFVIFRIVGSLAVFFLALTASQIFLLDFFSSAISSDSFTFCRRCCRAGARSRTSYTLQPRSAKIINKYEFFEDRKTE